MCEFVRANSSALSFASSSGEVDGLRLLAKAAQSESARVERSLADCGDAAATSANLAELIEIGLGCCRAERMRASLADTWDSPVWGMSVPSVAALSHRESTRSTAHNFGTAVAGDSARSRAFAPGGSHERTPSGSLLSGTAISAWLSGGWERTV